MNRLVKDWFYRLLRLWLRVIAVTFFDFRVAGRENLPDVGPAIILATHQSMIDSALVGLIFNVKLSYIARKTLFKQSVFAFFIRSLDAIEIDREKGGLAGLREMLVRLHAKKLVLIFPEGTRSRDGTIGEFKMGFASIARRSGATLVPMAISGADKVLKRGRVLPSRCRLAISVGRSISAEELKSLDDQSLKKWLTSVIRQCKQQADELAGASKEEIGPREIAVMVENLRTDRKTKR